MTTSDVCEQKWSFTLLLSVTTSNVCEQKSLPSVTKSDMCEQKWSHIASKCNHKPLNK